MKEIMLLRVMLLTLSISFVLKIISLLPRGIKEIDVILVGDLFAVLMINQALLPIASHIHFYMIFTRIFSQSLALCHLFHAHHPRDLK